jgi:tetratricopeptide (TPR) repeat protein
MKKTFLAFFVTGALSIGIATAQNIQDGINHLYADRFKNAEKIFKSLLDVNPNNLEAVYWLGQTYLDMDDNDAARQLYDKALQTNGNAPLIMVGRGHVHLVDKKSDEARQMFDAALTLSRTKKGDDPVILNAIGRAHIDAKEGNLDYAVQVLEKALERDPKSADIALNLGNAYRKKDPGQGGGKAFEKYKLATQLNSKFAYPYIRIAKLFETQKNWDLVLENLNKAIEVDPNFSLAYYELFYYYFFKGQLNEATDYLVKYINSRPGEDEMEQTYINSQLCWAKKDWNCAVKKAEEAKLAMGTSPKPRIFRLLAYAYLGKEDILKAKESIDEFFVRTKDAPQPVDYALKAEIYSAANVSCDELFKIYLDGAAADSVIQSKIDFMNRAADYFKNKRCVKEEADIRLAIYNSRKNPNPAQLVNLGILYSQSADLRKADSIFRAYNAIFPDSIYGYYWQGRVNYMMDTTMTVEPFISTLLECSEKTLMLAMTDKNRFKSMGVNAALVLTGYWNNIRSSRDTAYSYLLKGLELDSTHAQLKNIKQIFDTQKPGKASGTPSKGSGNPSSSVSKQDALDRKQV